VTYPVLDASGAERGRPSLLEDALYLARHTGEGTRVLRAEDGALLAIRGRVPRESPRPAGPQPPTFPKEIRPMSDQSDEIEEDESEAETDVAFVSRAIAKAGSAVALAKFTGADNSTLSKIRNGRASLSVEMRKRIEAYLAGGTPEGAEDGNEETGEEARVVRRRPDLARILQTPAPKTVQLSLDHSVARELYTLARSTGRAELALALSDALLAEVG